MVVLCSQKMPGKPDLREVGEEAEGKAEIEEGGSGGDVRKIQEDRKRKIISCHD